MEDQERTSAAADKPIYTIKTVVQETGIAPATLRAWERRYGCLSPGRSEGGYRLYSERDIALLRWLKGQVDQGVSISRAVALLEMRHQAGEEPELTQSPQTRTPKIGARDPQALVEELLEHLLSFHEAQADAVLSEAFALYPIEDVVEEVVTPTLVEIGERWHREQATVVQEHFATAFLRRRLTTLFTAYEQPQTGPLAITGSAPAEWHDVGILLVSLTLRRHGWRVIYLGQNVPAEHLLQEIRRLRPEMVCISATTMASTDELADSFPTWQAISDGRVRFVFGGRAFNLHPDLAVRFPGAHVLSSARALTDYLQAI